MKKIRDFCNVKQQNILSIVYGAMMDFHKSNDNPLTYALTGLIWNLTNLEHTDPRYLQEKLDIITTMLRRGDE